AGGDELADRVVGGRLAALADQLADAPLHVGEALGAPLRAFAARGGGEDVVHGTREPRPVLLGEAEPVEGDGGGDGVGEVADEVGRAQLDERVHGPCGVPGDHRPEPVDVLRGEQRVDQVAVAGGAGRVQLDRVLLQAGPAGDDDRDAVRAGRLAGGGEGVVVTGDARHVG